MTAELERRTEPTIDELMQERGWIRDGGCWVRPTRVDEGHVHSATCTVESCGAAARFLCASGPVCIRRFRQSKGQESAPCAGHGVPTRDRLIAYALEHKQIRAAAPRGTPIDDDEETTNTWSNER